MGAPKPSLGYPSRTDAVLAMRADNKSTEDIADALGITPNAVRGLESSKARHNGKNPSKEAEGRGVVFPATILDDLDRHAAKRAITPNHLARKIVEVVLRDNMVDAVLDDAEEVA